MKLSSPMAASVKKCGHPTSGSNREQLLRVDGGSSAVCRLLQLTQLPTSRRSSCVKSMKHQRLPRHQPQSHHHQHQHVSRSPASHRVAIGSGQVLPALRSPTKMAEILTVMTVCVTLVCASGVTAAVIPRRSTDGRRRYSVATVDAMVQEALKARRELRQSENSFAVQVNIFGDRQETNSSLMLKREETNSKAFERRLGSRAGTDTLVLQQTNQRTTFHAEHRLGFKSSRSSKMTSHQPVVSAETRSQTHRNSSSRQKRATQDGTDTRPNVLTPEQEDSLGTLVGEVMACEHIPGLALGISKGGKRQSEGYGVADMETGRPVDSNTLFGIGSNTKAFTAATLSQLMLTAPTGKKFTWDTPLTEILKDFQMPDHTRTASTTLTDVLSHQTGLASADVGFFAGFPLNMTTSDFASRLRFLPEVYPYRDKWHYSNMVYGVLTSLVCETVAGTTWTKLVRDVICDPLGMNNTVVTSDALQLDHVALPYILRMTADDMFVQQDLRLFNLHPLEATAALMSSASDMTLWMEHLLLALNNASTATQFAVKDTFADRVLLPPDYKRYLNSATQAPVEYKGFSLGWMSVKYRNTTIYEHRGDFFGYSSSVIVAPEHNMAVFMATNGPNSNAVFPALAHLSHYVLDVLQGRDPWVNVSILCPVKKGDDDLDSRAEDNADYDALDKNDDYEGSENTQNMKLKKFLRPVEDYLGTYGHGLLGNLHITRQEKRGTLRMELGRHLVADLIPTDQESVLSAVTRGPLADTKEWEKARPLVFIMARKGKATASSRHDTSVDGQSDVIENENREGNRSLTGSIAVSDKRSFSEVHLAWGIEVYVFKRGILFETALTEQEPITTMQDVERIDEPLTTTVTIDEPMTSTVTTDKPPTSTSMTDEPLTSTSMTDEPPTSTSMTDEPLTSTSMTDEPLTSTAAMFENTSLSAAAISRDASNGSSCNTVKALIVITFLFLATSVL